MWNPYQWWCGPGFFFGGPWGMLIGLIFWGAVIYGIVYLITHLPKIGHAQADGMTKVPDSSLEILRRRYAAGEIDAEEFARKRKDLES